MDAGVGHTVFDEAAVVDGALAEPWVAGLLVDEPELAGQEALAPVGPGRAAVQPLAALGVEREVIRMVGDEVAQLARGEVEGGLRALAQGVGRAHCASPKRCSRENMTSVPKFMQSTGMRSSAACRADMNSISGGRFMGR